MVEWRNAETESLDDTGAPDSPGAGHPSTPHPHNPNPVGSLPLSLSFSVKLV